jgi:FkbM family methyltransferase
MFNNCNEMTNGEYRFLESIKDDINIIFDVGSRSDSLFTGMRKIVHYFDPNLSFLSELSKKNNLNIESKFNSFGLSDKKGDLVYYDRFQSFVDRRETCGVDNDTKILKVETGLNYITENKIEKVDFLKIDTEGHELSVLVGFGDSISKVSIIQFEYGGTFKDAGIKLIDIINYLEHRKFHSFSYLTSNGHQLIDNFDDHYNYCNIICFNEKINIVNTKK